MEIVFLPDAWPHVLVILIATSIFVFQYVQLRLLRSLTGFSRKRSWIAYVSCLSWQLIAATGYLRSKKCEYTVLQSVRFELADKSHFFFRLD
jgi:hypothetical protein